MYAGINVWSWRAFGPHHPNFLSCQSTCPSRCHGLQSSNWPPCLHRSYSKRPFPRSDRATSPWTTSCCSITPVVSTRSTPLVSYMPTFTGPRKAGAGAALPRQFPGGDWRGRLRHITRPSVTFTITLQEAPLLSGAEWLPFPSDRYAHSRVLLELMWCRRQGKKRGPVSGCTLILSGSFLFFVITGGYHGVGAVWAPVVLHHVLFCYDYTIMPLYPPPPSTHLSPAGHSLDVDV